MAKQKKSKNKQKSSSPNGNSIVKKEIKKMSSRKKVIAAVLLILVLLLGGVCCWLFGLINPPELIPYDDNKTGVFFLDVGQGDSILIKTPTGKFSLIDAGTDDGEEALVKMLKEDYHVENIDYLILTHPHEDHVGGADAVIKNFKVDTVLMPDVGAATKTWTNVINAIDEYNCKDITVSAGSTFIFDTICYFTVLGPLDTDEDLNACSLVLKMDIANTSFLFTGDTTQSAEKAMLDRYGKDAFDADVLKVAHHGSSTSSSEAFLNAVSPEYAVISCGENNKYGHPHEEVMKRLKQLGPQILRTDNDGTVILQSDGETISVITGNLKTPIERYFDRIASWFS